MHKNTTTLFKHNYAAKDHIIFRQITLAPTN
jgi:hypothetical protein